MSDEAKRLNIRWRRILFGFHLLIGLLARLAVGSIHEMPPPEIYNLFALWGFSVVIHAVLLVIAEGRDRAPKRKRKNDVRRKNSETLLLTRDGELLEAIDDPADVAVVQRSKRH